MAVYPTGRRPSAEQLQDRRPGAQRLRPPVLRPLRLVRPPQGVVDRRAEVLRADRAVLHVRPDLVRLAVHRPATDAAAGQDRRVAVWPVLPAGDAVVLVDPRGPPELAHAYDQRALQQPA